GVPPQPAPLGVAQAPAATPIEVVPVLRGRELPERGGVLMPTPWSDRVHQLWRQTACGVPGCLRPRRRVGALCLKHERHKYLHGSPTARPLLKAEIKPYVKMVERAVKANRGHPALTDVYEALEALMQKSVEAASRIRSKPRPWDFTSRMYLELNRLHASGLTAVEMFTVASAVMLYGQWSNYDGPVLYCAVARHILIARQLGAHRHDPRIGSRPIRCSLNARIEIGRAIVNICYPTLAAIGEVL